MNFLELSVCSIDRGFNYLSNKIYTDSKMEFIFGQSFSDTLNEANSRWVCFANIHSEEEINQLKNEMKILLKFLENMDDEIPFLFFENNQNGGGICEQYYCHGQNFTCCHDI